MVQFIIVYWQVSTEKNNKYKYQKGKLIQHQMNSNELVGMGCRVQSHDGAGRGSIPL